MTVRLAHPVSGAEELRIVLASAIRALRGQTPASLRQYSFAVDHRGRHVRLKAEFEQTPSPDDLDAIDSAETEIAADTWDGWTVETSITVPGPAGTLDPLAGGIAYRRVEARADG